MGQKKEQRKFDLDTHSIPDNRGLTGLPSNHNVTEQKGGHCITWALDRQTLTTVMVFSFGTDVWANSADPDQTAPARAA